MSLRYAARMLRRTPSFTIPAVASLALGIAVNTTMFSVVNALLLRPIGRDGADLVRIGRSVRGDESFRSLTLEEVTQIRRQSSSFESVAAHQIEALTWVGPNGPEQVSAEFVSPSYFRTLRVPLQGRTFTESGDDLTGEALAVVIGDRFRRRHFPAGDEVLGRTLQLGAQRLSIIGVAEEGFLGTLTGIGTDLWVPFAARRLLFPASPAEEAGGLAIGRLKPGASMATAEAELHTIATRLRTLDPRRDPERGFSITSARGTHPALARAIGTFVALLTAVVAVVLLVSCTNVAGMLLARASARRVELATRIAIGAARGQIVRQLLVESLLLASLGAGAGLLLTVWATRALNAVTMIPGPTGPVYLGLGVDERVLAFTGAAVVITTLTFGLVPALQATRVDVVSALKDLGSGARRRGARLRTGLMIVQVALSVVLMIAATLLFRSVRNGASIDVGFQPDGVVVAPFNLQIAGYDATRATAFFTTLLRRVEEMPGIEHAALAEYAPMGDRGTRIDVRRRDSEPTHSVAVNRITEGFLGTIRQPLARGRNFVLADRRGDARAAIVNETLARRLWPGEDPIGKRITLGSDAAAGGELEIVGVVADARFASFGGEVGPFLYLPLSETYGRFLVLHARSSQSDAIAAVRRLASELDPTAAPPPVQSLRESMAVRLVPTRLAQMAFGIAGSIALLLAAAGLYGLVAYSLQQRLHEVGIRVALGASRASVFGTIVGGTLRITLAGAALGVLLAAGVSRLLSSMIVGVSRVDPVTFVGVPAMLLAVATIAGYVAARGGLNVAPGAVLRRN